MKTVSKKLVLLGNESVGKTSLVKRFVQSIFSDEYLSTIGIKISKKSVIVGDTQVNLMLWDIAGNMMNKTLYNNYLKGAHGVFLICDGNRPETYESIVTERENHLDMDFADLTSLVIVNKADLIEAKPEGYLDQFDYDFLTTAKTGDNVEAAFLQMATKLIED